jgi:hypothetical protein
MGIGDDAAAYGKVRNKISSVILFVIAFVLMIVSAAYIFSDEPLPVNGKATVMKAQNETLCTTRNSKTNCSPYSIVDVEFTASNGQHVQGSAIKMQRVVHKGELVSVNYDEKNPNNFKLEYTSNKTVGWILFVVAVVFGLAASLTWYMARFKTANQITAVGDLVSVFNR